LTTGVKIAIGCGVASILGIMVVAVAVFSGAYWLKGKTEEFTGNENRIEELLQKANAARFDRPEDEVIREDRLLTFLDIRKRIFSVYVKHRALLEAMGQKKQGDWGDVTKGFSVVNEIRFAQAQALADVGMSEDEYRFMVEQVYKTAGAAPNVELLRKYEAEIKKYAMAGLEWIGY
jgi:bifunctional pyridoxal-dependent enzyme with beta-cystathionase and maltose regulon repressor activities